MAEGAGTPETDNPHLGDPPSTLWIRHVLTSSRMQDLRRSRSSLVRDEWPWSLSPRQRKRLAVEEEGSAEAACHQHT